MSPTRLLPHLHKLDFKIDTFFDDKNWYFYEKGNFKLSFNITLKEFVSPFDIDITHRLTLDNLMSYVNIMDRIYHMK